MCAGGGWVGGGCRGGRRREGKGRVKVLTLPDEAQSAPR